MSTATDFQMTNEEKADAFFKVAMEQLDLLRSEAPEVKQVNPVAEQSGQFPYICDCICEIAGGYAEEDILRDEMERFGIPNFGFNVWRHIKAERRQEARWFFLMLMVEYLNDADNEEISN